jgi:hypothetical protein
MLLQQFGLGVVRRPAGPGSMEPALTRRVCFRKVSSQPGSLRFLPDRCVRSVRRAEKCAWVPCAGHAASGVFAKSFDGGTGASRGLNSLEARASSPIELGNA